RPGDASGCESAAAGGVSGETEGHAQIVRNALEARGAKPSRTKDAVMGVGGKGFVLFARLQPDTPGKLHAHALSYEALELSSSDLPALVPPGRRARRCAARRPDCDRGAHDDAAAGGALRPRRRRVPARGRSRRPDRAAAEVPRRCTRDREQAIALLARGPKLAGSERLATIYDDHLAETRDHAEIDLRAAAGARR